jgi:LSD1 subclass zinc finger protein
MRWFAGASVERTGLLLLLLLFGAAVACAALSSHVLAHFGLRVKMPLALLYGVPGVTTFTVLVLGAYGRRRAVCLRSLQSALAARPPALRGHASQCRTCGAPLYVPEGASGVRCAYCQSDNLLVVDRRWLVEKVGSSFRVLRRATDALAMERAEVRKLRRSLAAVLAMGALFFLFTGRLAWAELSIAARERQLVEQRLSTAPALRSSKPPFTNVEAQGDCSPKRPARWTRLVRGAATPSLCQGSGRCSLEYSIALRRGQRLELALRPWQPSSAVRVALRSRAWIQPAEQEQSYVAPEPVGFVAPADGLYAVEVGLGQDLADTSLCVAVR